MGWGRQQSNVRRGIRLNQEIVDPERAGLRSGNNTVVSLCEVAGLKQSLIVGNGALVWGRKDDRCCAVDGEGHLGASIDGIISYASVH